MLAKREDLLSWVLLFICSQTKFEFPIVNVFFFSKVTAVHIQRYSRKVLAFN